MTAQEKAKELWSKIGQYIDPYNDMGSIDNQLLKERTKECALITVSEILNMQLDDPSALDKEYWHDVKQELEKL